MSYSQHEGEVYYDDIQQIINYLEPRQTLDTNEVKVLLIRLKATQKYCKLSHLQPWEK